MLLDPCREHPLINSAPMLVLVVLLGLLSIVAGLGLPNPLVFEPSPDALTLASASGALPILYDSGDPEAVHIAVNAFADDIFRVTGVKPDVLTQLPPGIRAAIIVGTVNSELLAHVRTRPVDSAQVPLPPSGLSGAWEAFDAHVVSSPLGGLDEALVITGSDRVRTAPSLLTPARHHLRPLHPLGTHGRLAVVLVGRRPARAARDRRLQARRGARPRPPERQVPRLLPERRAARAVELGARALRHARPAALPGGDVRAGVRAPPPPQGELHVACEYVSY